MVTANCIAEAQKGHSDVSVYMEKVERVCVSTHVCCVHMKTESLEGGNKARHIHSQSGKFIKCHDKG